MKKSLFYTLVFSLLFVGMENLTAQGAYFQVRLGTAFDSNGNAQGTTGTENLDNNTFSIENVYGTSGGGQNGGIALGYMFSKNLGFELGLNYLIGSKDEVNYSQSTSNSTDTIFGSVDFSSTSIQTSYTRQFRVAPSIVLRASDEGLSPYARFGIILPVGGKTVTDLSVIADQKSSLLGVETESNSTTDAVFETTGNGSVGFQGAFGINFSISDNLGVFGELEYISLGIRSKETVITEYTQINTINGASNVLSPDVRLQDLPVGVVTTIYKDQLTHTSNATFTDSDGNVTNPGYDPEKATEALARTSYYNSIGINVGLKLSF